MRTAANSCLVVGGFFFFMAFVTFGRRGDHYEAQIASSSNPTATTAGIYTGLFLISFTFFIIGGVLKGKADKRNE